MITNSIVGPTPTVWTNAKSKADSICCLRIDNRDSCIMILQNLCNGSLSRPTAQLSASTSNPQELQSFLKIIVLDKKYCLPGP